MNIFISKEKRKDESQFYQNSDGEQEEMPWWKWWSFSLTHGLVRFQNQFIESRRESENGSHQWNFIEFSSDTQALERYVYTTYIE